jgi:citrate lyase beta subunit
MNTTAAQSSVEEMVRQARSIAEDVNEVCDVGGLGSLSLAVMMLADAVLAQATRELSQDSATAEVTQRGSR